MSYIYGTVFYIADFGDGPDGASAAEKQEADDAAEAAFDIPGLVRRVRRIRDLSQRDLAAVLGVHHSLVARWETGDREPRLATFRELLRLADIRLEARDQASRPVRTMRPDALRDGRGRRLPAHLDVFAFLHEAPVSMPVAARDRHWCVPHRTARDFMRARIGGPPAPDHPTRSQLIATLGAAKAEQVARQRADMAAANQARGYPAEPWQSCSCPDACFDSPGCAPACTCRCEDADQDWPGRNSWS